MSTALEYSHGNAIDLKTAQQNSQQRQLQRIRSRSAIKTGPTPPSISSSAVGSGESISFSWLPTNDPATVSYSVYRSLTNDPATSTRIGTVVQPPDFDKPIIFTDRPLASGTFYYWVSSLNAGGGESTLIGMGTVPVGAIQNEVTPERFGAVGDGVTDDKAAIQRAVNYLGAGGGVIQLAGKTYAIRTGLEINSNISMRGIPGQTFIKMTGSPTYPNNEPLIFRSTLGTIYTFNGALAAGTTSFTLATVAGLAVGDTIQLALGTDPNDTGQHFTAYFAYITSINAGTKTITITPGLPEAVAAATGTGGAATHEVYTFPNGVVEDCGCDGIGFDFDYDGGTVPDVMCSFYYTRNCFIRNAFSRKVTIGVLCTFSENFSIDKMYVDRAIKAHSSAGRLFTGNISRNTTLRDLYGRDVEAKGIFLENQMRTVTIDGLTLNYGAGVTIGTANGVHVVGGSLGVKVRNYTFNSVNLQNADFVSQGGELEIEDYRLYNGIKSANIFRQRGQLQVAGVQYLATKRASFTVAITKNGNTVATLPSGIIRNIRIYINSTTGLTNFYILTGAVGLDVASSLVAAQTVDLSSTFGVVGDDSAINKTPAKNISINTGATSPVGNYCTIDVEFYPVASGDDLSKALLQNGSYLERVNELWIAGPSGIGRLVYTDSSGVPDAILYRLGAGIFSADDTYFLMQATTPGTQTVFAARKLGETKSRLTIGADGTITWGGGDPNNTDTSLYRGAAGRLVAGQDFEIVGKVGFYNTLPVAQPTITGSRGGNAALAALLNALAGTGLIVDSTTV